MLKKLIISIFTVIVVFTAINLPKTADSASAITGAIIEDVFYDSQGLQIEGVICRPENEGQYPIVVLNHDGISGLNKLARIKFYPKCQDLVKEGYVVLMSSFRGEGKSQGNIEACKGEVDDALNFIEYAKTQPYTDATKVGMLGFSHGGCITLNAIAESQEIDAAVDFYGPTDMTALYNYWDYLGLIGILETFFPFFSLGSPDEIPGEYAARSAITKIDSINSPLLIFHGTGDPLVPITQPLSFVAELEKAGKNYFFIPYLGQAHGFTGYAAADSWYRTKMFLNGYLK